MAAVVSGVLLALCFPKADLGWLAWVALVPLFSVLLKESHPKRGFLAAYSFGLVFFLVVLYWIFITCRAGGASILLSFTGTLALAAVLALPFGVFGAAFSYIVGASQARGRPSQLLLPPLAAALWVSAEFFRERVMGFPWELLGYSQWRHTGLLQITAWTGVHGLSFLIIWINAALAAALLGPRRVKVAVKGLGPAAFAVAATAVYGAVVLGTYRPPAQRLKLALLQGNIDQYMKWDEAFVADIQKTYSDLAAQAAGGNPDLIIWPESSLPGWLEEPSIRRWAVETVQRTHAYNVVGAVTHDERGGVVNAGVLFDPQGRQLASYAKRHLVPFGEYVPLQDFLGRWAPILTTLGGVSAGTDATPLPYPKVPLGAAICYEIIMPDEVRESVRLGAMALVNLTNDGWYLDTAGPYQHLSMAVMRAAENRRPLIRAANTGISIIVDERGRILDSLGLGRRGVLQMALPLDTNAPMTFFTRFGEIFAGLCAFASLAALWLSRPRKA